jgi:GNAT superfamily N-acetyltransferase
MSELQVTALDEYSPEVAAELGKLMPDLSANLSDESISQERLEMIIDSPFHDQLIARLEGRIVGAATMSLVLGSSEGNTKAWLEDFVVSSDESIRGQGVGYQLWQRIIAWSQEKQAAKLEFTSRPERDAAHAFYYRQGAKTRDTTVFEVKLRD